MEATQKDRAHIAAIAEATRAEEEQAIAAAAAMTPSERLAAGFALMDDAPWTPAQLAQIDADADSQMELARRRVAMGLTLRKR